MRLGGPAAPRATQAVIVRLDSDPTGRLLLPVPVSAGTGRVLVRPTDRGVDADGPADLPGRVGVRLQRRQDPHPGAVALPAAKPPVQRLPRRIRLRHVPPRRPGAHPPPDPINNLPSGPPGRTTPTRRRGQHRLQYRPLRVSQIVPPRCRYAGHEVSGRYSGLLGR
jgi:hypothetical protein